MKHEFLALVFANGNAFCIVHTRWPFYCEADKDFLIFSFILITSANLHKCSVHLESFCARSFQQVEGVCLCFASWKCRCSSRLHHRYLFANLVFCLSCLLSRSRSRLLCVCVCFAPFLSFLSVPFSDQNSQLQRALHNVFGLFLYCSIKMHALTMHYTYSNSHPCLFKVHNYKFCLET